MIFTFNFWWQLTFASLATCIGWTYLAWRIWQIYLLLPKNAIPYIFLGLEFLMHFSAVLWFIDMLWTENKKRKDVIMPLKNANEWPEVDVLVPCCKEPTELVKDTVLAALWQDYPADKFTVCICDDGGDDNLKLWVENERAVNNTNVRYIRRVKTKGVPHHAKAGNINHALGLTTGEFVGILDADMIVSSNFLRSMLANFDASTAFVQCPQSYYNVPKGDPLGHMCTFFYDTIMTNRDTRNSAPSVGTGVIFRRRALEEIGGISTGTLTEDFDTSLKLQRLKWRTVYYNKKLQHGLVPTELRATLRQRERWAIGTLEILFKRNPLFASGLSWHQRIMYFSCGLSYLLPIAILLFISIPVLTLFFDWPIMPVTSGNAPTLIYLLVPYLFCTRIVIYVMYWKTDDSITARNRDFQLFLWMAPYLAIGFLKFVFSGIIAVGFKVTNAGKKSVSFFSEQAKDIIYCWFHILYLFLGVAGLIYRAVIVPQWICVPVFNYISQVFYVLMNMQAMLVPVIYAIFPPKDVDRRTKITYSEFGVPSIDQDKAKPEKTKSTILLEAVPLLWGAFYLAIFLGFLFNYHFGCDSYFSDSPVNFSTRDWNRAISF